MNKDPDQNLPIDPLNLPPPLPVNPNAPLHTKRGEPILASETLEQEFAKANMKLIYWGLIGYHGADEEIKRVIVRVARIFDQAGIDPKNDLEIDFIQTTVRSTDVYFRKSDPSEPFTMFIGPKVEDQEILKFINHWKKHKGDPETEEIIKKRGGYDIDRFYEKEGFSGDSIYISDDLKITKGDKIKFTDIEDKEFVAKVVGFDAASGQLACVVERTEDRFLRKLRILPKTEIVYPRQIIEVVSEETESASPENASPNNPGEQENTNTKEESTEAVVIPEWRNGPEWQAMANARQNFVEAEYDYNEVKESKDIGDEIKAYRRGIGKQCYDTYQESKEAVKRKISEHVLAGADYGALSPEEKKKIDSKVKLYIINEIYSTEYRAYRKAQKEKEQLEIIVSAKEMLGRALSNKAVKWYLGIKWYYRIPATTALLTVAGYGLGLAAVGTTLGSAGAFAGARMARGAATFGVGTAVRGAIEKFGQKNEAVRKENLEEIATQDLNEMETIRAVQGINQQHDRIQKWVKRAKVASGFAVAGLGMLAGSTMAGAKTTESALGDGVHNSPTTAPVGTGAKGFLDKITNQTTEKINDLLGPDKPKLPKSLDMSPPPSTGQVAEMANEIFDKNKPEITPSSAVPAPEEPSAPSPAETPTSPDTEVPDTSDTTETAKVAEGLFTDPEVVKVEVANGSSTWNILKDIMENNEKFKNLSGSAEEIMAKKTFVISNLTNEVLRQSEAIGLGEGGSIKVGDDLDFSEIFADKAKVEDILDKAESLSKSQMQNITEINGKIARWVADPQNAGKPLTGERVTEILSEKTEAQPPAAPAAPEASAPDIDIGEKLGELDYKLGSSVLKAKFPEEVAKLAEELKKLEAARGELETHSEGSIDYEESANHLKNQIEDVETQLSTLSKKLLQKDARIESAAGDLELAKQNDAILKQAQNFRYSNPAVDIVQVEEHTPLRQEGYSAMRENAPEPVSLNSAEFESQLQEGFKSSIDVVYGKKGVFGLRKIAGVDTPEWKQIANLPADKVLQYYESPKNPNLEKNLVDILSKSTKHRSLIEGINKLKTEILSNSDNHVDLRPYSNGETIEKFIKRLGAFRMKQSSK